jgi:hypothetical protein
MERQAKRGLSLVAFRWLFGVTITAYRYDNAGELDLSGPHVADQWNIHLVRIAWILIPSGYLVSPHTMPQPKAELGLTLHERCLFSNAHLLVLSFFEDVRTRYVDAKDSIRLQKAHFLLPEKGYPSGKEDRRVAILRSSRKHAGKRRVVPEGMVAGRRHHGHDLGNRKGNSTTGNILKL